MAKLTYHFDFLVIYCTLLLLSTHSYLSYGDPLDKKITTTSSSAFFIFGDSTVDPGNNNYINTIPDNRADYKPYGLKQNGYFEGPTGRFSDGRVVVDFIVDKKSISSAFFIFGDSIVDPGNNNYIDTTPDKRADYKPYGQNGYFEGPTGRFSNGRVIVDFIAEYAKLPMIPPFLQPSAEYINGVNFASGGAGVLSETNQGLVIDLQSQLKNFEAVQKSLAEKLGDTQAQQLISEAVYFFSIGSNDYMGGYLGSPKMQQLYHPEQYVGMVIGNLTRAIQVLYEKGGRKFGFLSLSPLGCLPALRALNPKASDGGCFEEACALALAHNNALSAVLTNLGHLLGGFKYSNIKFYSWLHDRINHPSKYGFKDGVNACCGTGPYGGIYTCGGTKKVTDYQLCNNTDDHVWFDSFHPTERIHEQTAKELWNGPPFSVGPYNLEELFFDKEKPTIIADLVDIPQVDQVGSLI